MISKPWFQILFFVLVANLAQGVTYYLAMATQSELSLYVALGFSCLVGTALLTAPVTATTGHKLLTLTFAAATLYFASAILATTWTLYGSMTAYFVYSRIHDSFSATMQFFTALEILCIFANAAAKMGRIGDIFQRVIDYVYNVAFLRTLHAFRLSRV
jgi:hypothetical protein